MNSGFLAMLEHVRQIIQKFQLITAGQTVIVGVSGGRDSLVLLHILKRLALRQGIRLHAATLDHQLRGEESVEDVRFVEQVCREWGIGLTVGQADVSSLAREQQLGIEAAARLARYDFMAEVAHGLGASSVAVAHHADDQAETVLLHLLRGAGIHGLAGMALRSPVPGHADLSLIRPLLRVSRAEIEAYCREHQLVARYDSSNSDTALLRNAIRLEVLPVLSQYSPQVKAALARLAEISAVEDDYVQQHVLLFTKSAAVTVSRQRISIDRDAFRGLHSALQRRVLLWTAAQLGQTEDTSANLILDTNEIALHGRQGAVALLGGELRLRVEYNLLLVETQEAGSEEQNVPLLPAHFERDIAIPSKNTIAGWTLHTTLTEPYQLSRFFDTAGESKILPPSFFSVYKEGEQVREISGDKIDSQVAAFCRLAIPPNAKVILRTRRVGDIFLPLGMKGHSQKLSRWMVNRKIPQTLRDHIPLVVVDNVVAAIIVNGDWIISETFAIRNISERIIHFQFL